MTIRGTRWLVALAAIGLLMTGCGGDETFNSDTSSGAGGGSGAGDDGAGDGDDEPQVDVSGTWDTQWGSTYTELSLSQSGSAVSGSYELAGSFGSIDGTLDGLVLEGSWADGTGSGDIRFVFSSDGDSFDGTWSGSNPWSGTRQ